MPRDGEPQYTETTPMATAPRHYLEPLPHLHMSVDYRRDPLFFRIPSPKRPLSEVPPKIPRRGEAGGTRPVHPLNIIGESCSYAVQRKVPGDSFGGKPLTSEGAQSRRGKEQESESPRIARSGAPRQGLTSRTVMRQEGGVGVSSKPSPRPSSPSSVFSGACGMDGAGVDGRPSAVSTAPRGVNKTPRCLNRSTVLHSPRLTRSAILRKEANAHDVLNGKTAEVSRVAPGRAHLAPRNIFPEDGCTLTLRTRGRGVVPKPTAVTSLPQDRAEVDVLSRVPASATGAKISAYHVFRTRRRLDLDGAVVEPVESLVSFSSRGRSPSASLGVVNGNRHFGHDAVEERCAIPPVPEFRDIVPRRAMSKGAAPSALAVMDGDGGKCITATATTAATTTTTAAEAAAQVKEQTPCGEAEGERRLSSPSACSRVVASYSAAGVVSPVTGVDGGDVATATHGDSGNTAAANRAESRSLEGGKVDDGSATSLVQQDELLVGEMGEENPLQEDTEVDALGSLLGDGVVREGTSLPVNVAEALYAFSSDAFSDETSLAPRSLNSEEEEAAVPQPPPSYWRLETLPMVERKGTCSPPSLASAEADTPPPMLRGAQMEESSPAATSPEASPPPPPLPSAVAVAAAVAGASVPTVLRTSRCELAERLASVPRYLLLEHATTNRVGPAQSTRGSILPKYMTLRRTVRMYVLGSFFRRWSAWTARRSVVTCERTSCVGHLSNDANSDGGVSPGGSAAFTAVSVEGGAAATAAEHEAQRNVTPICSRAPAGEKSPRRPLSLEVLEEAHILQQRWEQAAWSCGGRGSDGTCTSESSSFRSVFLAQEAAVFAQLDGLVGLRAESGLISDVARPYSPVNCTPQKVADICSHAFGSPRGFSADVSEIESALQQTTDVEEIIVRIQDAG